MPAVVRKHSSIFSSNTEAFTSELLNNIEELLENTEEMFPQYYIWSEFLNSTTQYSVLPIGKRLMP